MTKHNCLAFLICVVVFLIIGCGRQYQRTIVIEVDGEEYSLCQFGNVNQAGEKISFTALNYPDGPVKLMKYSSLAGVEVVTIADKTPKTETLYYVRDGKIAVIKTYQELGIDAQKMNADNEEVLDYLQPILEKLIRENVPKQ